MFGLRRKIGTGATSRRRPARECKVGIECLDTRAVPAILVSTPGSPIVESGTPTNLNVSFDEFGHGFASLTNPATGALLAPAAPLATNLSPSGALQNIPGVVGAGTANPLTLAYHLPTAVNPGDVAVLQFQTGKLSDLIRFTDVVTPETNSVQGWMLIYSDFSAANPADSPADTFNTDTNTGLPADFNPFSPLTTSAFEFGVEGLDVVDYQAEQAFYSGFSDGNPISATGA